MSTHVQIYKCHCPHFMTLQCADDLYPCQQCQLFASSSHSIRISGRFNTWMIFIMPAISAVYLPIISLYPHIKTLQYADDFSTEMHCPCLCPIVYHLHFHPHIRTLQYADDKLYPCQQYLLFAPLLLYHLFLSAYRDASIRG